MPRVVDLSKYPGRFVARILDQIIAVGDSMEEVIEKAREKGYDPRDVIIEYVPDEEIIFIF